VWATSEFQSEDNRLGCRSWSKEQAGRSFAEISGTLIFRASARSGILETACPQAVFRFIFVRRPHSQDGCASSCVFTCAIQSAKSPSSVVVSKKSAIENLQVT
jgi:hypothetical protein